MSEKRLELKTSLRNGIWTAIVWEKREVFQAIKDNKEVVRDSYLISKSELEQFGQEIDRALKGE